MWTKSDHHTFNTGFRIPVTDSVDICFPVQALIHFDNRAGNVGFNTDGDFQVAYASSTTNEYVKRVHINFGTSTYNNDEGSGFGDGISLYSLDPTGFTLQFPAWGTYPWDYMAAGGDELQAAVGSFNTNAGTFGDVAVTGVGFQPDFVWMILGYTNGGFEGSTAMGMASGPSNQGCVSINRFLFGTVGAGFLDDAVIDYNQGAQTLALASFDSDGFTCSTVNSSGSAVPVHFLAIKDPTAAFHVGTDSQKTSTGTKATTGVGFQPGAAFFIGSELDSVGYDTSSFPTMISFSSTDGTDEDTGHISSASTSQCSYGVGGELLTASDPSGPTVVAAATLDSFNSDGFTLDWTTADSRARNFVYCAIRTERRGNNPCDLAPIVSLYVTYPE